MTEAEGKPLQATFDIDDYDSEVVEGIGFEPGKRYEFTLEKAPQGKYMQYGAAKGGLYVLSKKCPEDLRHSYEKHPDQFEIFSTGEINGIQALVPGRDFDKFKPYLTKTASVAWVHNSDSGQKRLIFMNLNADEKTSVNPTHPEWESRNVRLARKCGMNIPNPGTPEFKGFRFNLSFLHPGVTITSEVVMTRKKNDTRDRAELDIDTIELVSADGETKSQKSLPVDDIDAEIKMNILEHADGCKSVAEVVKKVRAFLKEQKITDTKVLGDYTAAIQKMKDRKEILA